jgi:transposase InsO family protein
MDVRLLCDIAKVSKSGYYKWKMYSCEIDKDYEDYLIIKEVFDKGRGKYGFRTIQMNLKIKMNHKKIIRIKNKYGLITKIRRINPYKMIMKKSIEHRTCENLLDRKFKQEIPFKTFCTDITYLPFNHRMAYFSAVKDIATGEIVGWNISQHLQMNIVLDTLENLKKNIDSLQGVLIHSDQGVHYTNPEFINGIKNLKMIQSMSRKGNCIDNAPMESFFGHMKDDVDYKKNKTYEELRLQVEEYVRYYNNERPQWERKKMTPVEYRNHLFAQK